MATSRVLEIHDLWKSYDGQRAVQGLSLEVSPGEIVGLVGPNGAGKTTTLRILMGLVEMDAGRVVVGGQEVGSFDPRYKAAIGYLPESPSLPEYLTALEFLGYVARLRGVAPAEVRPRVDRALKDFDLWGDRDRPLSGFSKGMKQRAAIASSLLHNPTLLVWDEPFLGIDPAAQHQVKVLLREHAAAGHSVLISTHVLDTAERLCHRVVIIQEGRAVAQGDLATLRALASVGQETSLEEVFLRLTKEAQGLAVGEAPVGRRRWWRRP